MAEQIAGRFAIEKMIGYGGMGEVYKGTDTNFSQPVAIKLLKPEIVHEDPNILERFEREGEALRRLNHPNIVKMLASVEENGKHYLVMEYVSGGSLQQLLREQPQLPVKRVLEISLDLADALTRAHRLKIIHRDLKPANVLLAEDGTPRLTDFGVARLDDRTRMTVTGSLVGTYAYLSPEACSAELLDERTDIWAFGIIMYEMLAGKRPFDSEQPAAIILKIMTEPIPDLQAIRPDVPAEFIWLIYEMLEKDRDLRVSSIREVGARLEKLLRMVDDNPGNVPQITSRFSTPPHTKPPAESVNFKSFLNKSIQPLPQEVPLSDSMITLHAARRRQRFSLLLGIVLTLAVVGAVFLFTRDSATPKDEIILVEPVADDEYMVLVAELENIEGEERPVTRLLVNELTQTLESEIPFSAYRVRAYPNVISTPEEAFKAAEANKATLVIWGNYTPDVINLELQVGVTNAFSHIEAVKVPREMLERTANISVQLADVQKQSIAPMIIRMTQVLETANGNTFNLARNIAIMDEMVIDTAEIQSSGVSREVQNFFEYYVSDTQKSVEATETAIGIDAGNPLLYLMRSGANQRLGNTEAAQRDALTAQRLGGDEWAMPYIALGNHAVYFQNNVPQGIESYTKVIELRPEDWFAFTFRGVMYYALGEYEAAKTDLDKAIELEPQANWPYIYATLLALREGRIATAQAYNELVVHEFPDPTLANRGIQGFYGSIASNFIGLTFSAGGNMVLGRYNEALTDANAALQISQVAELYLIQGFSHCNLGDDAAAEESYAQAITLDPDFAALYLLRAEVLLRQNKLPEALSDIQKAKSYDLGAEFDALIEAGQTGEISCHNFFG